MSFDVTLYIFNSLYRTILHFITITAIVEHTYSCASGNSLQDLEFFEEHGLRNKIAPDKALVFGPGLQSEIVLPARYIFIQPVDQHGKNITVSLPHKIDVKITGQHEICQVWPQVLHTHDGLVIARFRLYHMCNALKITIMYKDIHLAKSPYLLQGPFYDEFCNCPLPAKDWLKVMGCPSNYSQILRDLAVFPHVDMEAALEDAVKRYNRPGAFSFCHYTVLENQIYRKCYGQYVGFSMFMDEILLSLSRKVELPNVEMLVNLGDWPLESREAGKNLIPFFSWCGSENTRDIVMPTYDITESSLEMLGRVMLDILFVHGNSGPHWERKTEKAFWRGRDSCQERLDLVKLARQHPDLINASLTNFFFFREKEQEYGPKSEHMSFLDFFQYKYQVNIDGTVAAYRMPYLLAGGSLVLKQDSEYYEHFYHMLRPYIHYVPFKRDLSDLVSQLKWAMSHDSEVRKIAANARQFTLDHLLPPNIYCYYYLLLLEYSKKLIDMPKVMQDMEEVRHPSGKPICLCMHGKIAKQLREEL